MKDKIHVLSRAVIRGWSDKAEKILLCKTLDLANNFYFLPGGHVEHGESTEGALIRELKEETGHECTIIRYLGCLEYSFEPGRNSICHNHEYNFIHEASCPHLTPDKPIKSQEAHIELCWQNIIDLDKIDFRPQPLRPMLAPWLNSTSNQNFVSELTLES